jgi:hypothetical protein
MIKSSVSGNTSKMLMSNNEEGIITIYWPGAEAYGLKTSIFKILLDN